MVSVLERRATMLKNCAVLVLVVGLFAGLISCEKLPSGLPKGAFEGPLPFETAKFKDAIPLEYGPLVGVTRSPDAGSYWVALWFEKPDKTIAVVWVNVLEGKIGEKITTIPRK
jgi:hypothetical protein